MIWGFFVYFVYMIPLETDVLRKHRFQKQKIVIQDQLSLNAGQKHAICNTFNLHLATFCHLDLCFVYFGVAFLHRVYCIYPREKPVQSSKVEL